MTYRVKTCKVTWKWINRLFGQAQAVWAGTGCMAVSPISGLCFMSSPCIDLAIFLVGRLTAQISTFICYFDCCRSAFTLIRLGFPCCRSWMHLFCSFDILYFYYTALFLLQIFISLLPKVHAPQASNLCKLLSSQWHGKRP